MGITSLNSAVLYIVSLCFLFYRSFASAQDDRNAFRMISKSCKYNKYPILNGAEP